MWRRRSQCCHSSFLGWISAANEPKGLLSLEMSLCGRSAILFYAWRGHLYGWPVHVHSRPGPISCSRLRATWRASVSQHGPRISASSICDQRYRNMSVWFMGLVLLHAVLFKYVRNMLIICLTFLPTRGVLTCASLLRDIGLISVGALSDQKTCGEKFCWICRKKQEKSMHFPRFVRTVLVLKWYRVYNCELLCSKTKWTHSPDTPCHAWELK